MNQFAYRPLLGHIGWLGAGEALNRLAGLFIAFYLARVLLPEWYGKVGTAFAVFSFVAILVQVGLEPRGMREVSRNPGLAAATYSSISSLRIVLAAISFTLLLMFTPLLAAELNIPGSLLTVFSLCFFPIALTATWTFRALENMRMAGALVAAQRVLAALAIVILVTDGAAHYLNIAWAEVVALTVVAAWSVVGLNRIVGGLAFDPGLRRWPSMIREALPVAGSRVLMLVYSHGDVILLGALAGPLAAGLFLAAQKLTLAVAQLSFVFLMASFPEVARRLKGEPAAAFSLQADVLRYLFAIVTPFIVATMLFAQDIVSFVFGRAYLEAGQVLTILALTIPFFFAGGTLRQLLFASAMPAKALTAYAAGAVVHVALAIYLISVAGAPGAAIACLAGEVISMSVMGVSVWRSLRGLPFRLQCFAPLAAGLVSAALMLLLDPLGALYVVAAGLVSYLGGLYALGGVSRQEVGALIQILRSRGRPGKESIPP